ncbi:hypothetical protein K7X08_032628 [Anisodus acutangulus]|uniref:Uncharacterized protein n=1 Tax=Anisodus acutangulus TaxID=402998 RepID=A0A9Q1R7X2_9SOLA|nr:hypothetical protein K7X08_032628 [Anisodus acutangulus]
MQNRFDLLDSVEENEHIGVNQHNGGVGITKGNEGNNAEKIEIGADEIVKNTAKNVDRVDKSDDLQASKEIDDEITNVVDGNADQIDKIGELQASNEEEEHTIDEATEPNKVQEHHYGVVNNEDTLIEHELIQKGVSSSNEEVQHSKASSKIKINKEAGSYPIKQVVDPNITSGAMNFTNTNVEIQSVVVVRKNSPNKVLHDLVSHNISISMEVNVLLGDDEDK